MIGVSCSLDSSFAQAKRQGNLQAAAGIYLPLSYFDVVALLTQDVQIFNEKSENIIHVPCAYSKNRTMQFVAANVKMFRWLYFSFSSFFWLMRNRQQINIVVSENVDSLSPMIFSVLFKKPYFIRYHYDVAAQLSQVNKHPFEGMLLLFFEKLCFRQATCVWITTQSLAEKAENLGAKKVKVIPNWIDIDRRLEHSFEKYNSSKYQILFVGRLHPVKRVGLLIQAFCQLSRVHKQASLLIVGDGEERQQLMGLATDLGIVNAVKFLGFQSHEKVLKIMSESDLLVLPSLMEGNPRVLVEAMMSKVPIVATNVPGIADIVKSGETGFLVDKPTPERLAETISHVILNREKAIYVAENANSFAKKNFSKEEVLKKYHDDIALLVT